jgi:hypothetical protein
MRATSCRDSRSPWPNFFRGSGDGEPYGDRGGDGHRLAGDRPLMAALLQVF